MRDSSEAKSTELTLIEDGKMALEPTREITVTLNFPESTIALRIGAPIVPEAYDSQYTPGK